jgi:glycosyltransferase involved in cell wall biosynthesis
LKDFAGDMKDTSREVVYITQMVSAACLDQRRNHRHLSEAANHKSAGMAALMDRSGYHVTLLSPSLVNDRSARFFGGFEETFEKWRLIHAGVWDIPAIHILTSVFFLCLWLFRNRSTYQKILFYNFRPETAIPAYFARIFLRKRIYVEYEDGYFALKIRTSLRWTINILERLGNVLISGATVVTLELKSRLKTSNVQWIPGFFNEKIRNAVFTSSPSGRRPGEDPVIFMYSGTLDEIRGVDLFLGLAEKIIGEDIGRCKFWITGKGPLEPLAKKYAERFPDEIEFFGFVTREKLHSLYQRTDVFVSLQKPQDEFSKASFPSKLYEFASTGKLVIGESYTFGTKTLEDIYQQMKAAVRGETGALSSSLPDITSIDIFQR